jgi:hypothetical protein
MTQSPLTKALSAPDSPLRVQLVGLVVDAILSKRLVDLVDITEITDIVAKAASEESALIILTRYAAPIWDRHRARSEAAHTKLGDHLPTDTAALVAGLLEVARWPQAPWIEAALDPVLLRALLAPVAQRVLMSFARKLPIVGGGQPQSAGSGSSGGGLLGMLKKHAGDQAKRIVDAGLSVADKFGLGEDKLQQFVRDFSQQAIDETRTALRERLTSDEGKPLLAQLQRRALDQLMRESVAALMDDLDAVPRDQLNACAAKIAAHISQSKWLHNAITSELTTLLAVEGTKTLQDILEEAHLLTEVRAVLVRLADSVARAVVASEGFGDWLAQATALLASAPTSDV